MSEPFKVSNDIILDELAGMYARQAIDLAVQRGAVRLLRAQLEEWENAQDVEPTEKPKTCGEVHPDHDIYHPEGH